MPGQRLTTVQCPILNVRLLIEPLLDTLWSAALHAAGALQARAPLAQRQTLCSPCPQSAALLGAYPGTSYCFRLLETCRPGSRHLLSLGHTGKGRAAGIIACCLVHVVSRGRHTAQVTNPQVHTTTCHFL